MRRARIIVLAFVATTLLTAVPAAADTGVGEFGSITVEPVCIGDESGRRISVTANADNMFDAPLFVFSAEGTSYEIDSLLAYYAPGETLIYDIPVSEYDTDEWYLFAGWDGDAGYQAVASARREPIAEVIPAGTASIRPTAT